MMKCCWYFLWMAFPALSFFGEGFAEPHSPTGRYAYQIVTENNRASFQKVALPPNPHQRYEFPISCLRDRALLEEADKLQKDVLASLELVCLEDLILDGALLLSDFSESSEMFFWSGPIFFQVSKILSMAASPQLKQMAVILVSLTMAQHGIHGISDYIADLQKKYPDLLAGCEISLSACDGILMYASAISSKAPRLALEIARKQKSILESTWSTKHTWLLYPLYRQRVEALLWISQFYLYSSIEENGKTPVWIGYDTKTEGIGVFRPLDTFRADLESAYRTLNGFIITWDQGEDLTPLIVQEATMIFTSGNDRPLDADYSHPSVTREIVQLPVSEIRKTALEHLHRSHSVLGALLVYTERLGNADVETWIEGHLAKSRVNPFHRAEFVASFRIFGAIEINLPCRRSWLKAMTELNFPMITGVSSYLENLDNMGLAKDLARMRKKIERDEELIRKTFEAFQLDADYFINNEIQIAGKFPEFHSIYHQMITLSEWMNAANVANLDFSVFHRIDLPGLTQDSEIVADSKFRVRRLSQLQSSALSPRMDISSVLKQKILDHNRSIHQTLLYLAAIRHVTEHGTNSTDFWTLIKKSNDRYASPLMEDYPVFLYKLGNPGDYTTFRDNFSREWTLVEDRQRSDIEIRPFIYSAWLMVVVSSLATIPTTLSITALGAGMEGAAHSTLSLGITRLLFGRFGFGVVRAIISASSFLLSERLLGIAPWWTEGKGVSGNILLPLFTTSIVFYYLPAFEMFGPALLKYLPAAFQTGILREGTIGTVHGFFGTSSFVSISIFHRLVDLSLGKRETFFTNGGTWNDWNWEAIGKDSFETVAHSAYSYAAFRSRASNVLHSSAQDISLRAGGYFMLTGRTLMIPPPIH